MAATVDLRFSPTWGDGCEKAAWVWGIRGACWAGKSRRVEGEGAMASPSGGEVGRPWGRDGWKEKSEKGKLLAMVD